MGHQRRYIPFLLGIGIRVFSMNSIFLPRIQKFIAELTIAETEELAASVLEKGSVAEVAAILGT